MKQVRSAIRVACLLAFCAGLPTLSGCGDSGATTTAPPEIDQAQAKAAEEATAKAYKERPKTQAQPQSKFN
jgi:hypothetical protein